jgi:hypothetical protein
MVMSPVQSRLIAAVLILVLVFPLAGCISDPAFQRDEGEAQIKIDRPYAEQNLKFYLSEKYGFSETDYSVAYLEPRTNSSLVIGAQYTYYTGGWQAQIKIRTSGKSAYVQVSGTKDSHGGTDTLQSDEYLNDLRTWFYHETELSDKYKLTVSAGGDAVTPIKPISAPLFTWLFTGRTYITSLVGYYDGENLFSPVTQTLVIRIHYPRGTPDSEYLTEEELAAVFPESSVTGDITIMVVAETPGDQFTKTDLLWARYSSDDRRELDIPDMALAYPVGN